MDDLLIWREMEEEGNFITKREEQLTMNTGKEVRGSNDREKKRKK